MSRRNALLLAFAASWSCTCEHDTSVIAAADGATLTRNFEKELGCGAAGGHGFGIIFPTVDDDTELTLSLDEQDFALEHICGPGSAELAVSPDKRVAAIRCAGADMWHVSFLLADRAVSRSTLAEKADFTAIGSLADNAGNIAHRHLAAVLEDLETRDDREAVLRALEATVAAGETWDTRYENASPPERERLRAALVESLNEGAPTGYRHIERALRILTEPQHRAALVDAVYRRADSGDPLQTSNICNLIEQLAESEVDDLSKLACHRAEQCRSAAMAVLATTGAPCDNLDKLPTTLCRTAPCEECSEEAVAEKLAWAVENRAVPDSQREATAWLTLAVLQKSPSLKEEMERRLARRNYELTVDKCGDNPKPGARCLCASESFVRGLICEAPLDQTERKIGRCTVSIDDDGQTVSATFDSESASANASIPDAGPD